MKKTWSPKRSEQSNCSCTPNVLIKTPRADRSLQVAGSSWVDHHQSRFLRPSHHEGRVLEDQVSKKWSKLFRIIFELSEKIQYHWISLNYHVGVKSAVSISQQSTKKLQRLQWERLGALGVWSWQSHGFGKTLLCPVHRRGMSWSGQGSDQKTQVLDVLPAVVPVMSPVWNTFCDDQGTPINSHKLPKSTEETYLSGSCQEAVRKRQGG